MMKLETNAVTVAATVEFRTYEEFKKGLTKGKGFEWVCVETDNDTHAVFAEARRKAVQQGLMTWEVAQAASLIVTSYDAQWDKDGKAVGNWRG